MDETQKEEKVLGRERIRERYRSCLSSMTIDPTEVEKEMAIRYEIALRMMMDQVPDEKIRYYTLLAHMQIEYVRATLLPDAIADSERKTRAMNESLRRSMSYIPWNR